MSASTARRRRTVPLSPRAAFSAVQHAVVNLEGAAVIAFAAVEGIGGDAEAQDAARFSADRLLQSDVLALRAAVDAMERAMLGGGL